MNEAQDKRRQAAQRLRTWRRTAIHTAIVAGAFSAVVCGKMVWAYGHMRANDPVDSPAILALRETMKQRPDDREIVRKIRRTDLALRTEFFWGKHFVQSGAIPLAGGLMVLLAAVKTAQSCHEKLPALSPVVDARKEDARVAAVARWTVGALLFALLGAALALVLMSAEPPALQVERAPATAPAAGGKAT